MAIRQPTARMSRLAGLIGAGLLVAGCVPTTSPDAAATLAADPTRDPAGCAAEIAKFIEIIDYDVSVGRLDKGVHARAKSDVAQAESVCAAGRQVQARAILIYTKKNYGYS